MRERGNIFGRLFQKTNHFSSALFILCKKRFWSSEEIFFIDKKSNFLIIKVSFFAKIILEFGRKKFGGGGTFSFCFLNNFKNLENFFWIIFFNLLLPPPNFFEKTTLL